MLGINKTIDIFGTWTLSIMCELEENWFHTSTKNDTKNNCKIGVQILFWTHCTMKNLIEMKSRHLQVDGSVKNHSLGEKTTDADVSHSTVQHCPLLLASSMIRPEYNVIEEITSNPLL